MHARVHQTRNFRWENPVFVIVERRVDDDALNSRARSRTRTKTTKKAFPETTIPSRQHDARPRFNIRDVDRDVNTCFFPFFTNDSSRDASNAPRTARFAAPSNRRRGSREGDSTSGARFVRRHTRDAVRSLLVIWRRLLLGVQLAIREC